MGRRIRGRDRSDEHRAVLAELVEMAQENDVDLTVVAGDIFDTASPSPMAERIAWRALIDLAEVSPVAVIAGNHDSAARLDAVAPLLAIGQITMVGTPRSPEGGGVVFLEDLGAKVAMLPFVSQRGIVKAEDIMESDPDQHAGAYEERLRRVVERLAAGMDSTTVNVLVSHLTVYGALAGGGERQAHIFGYAVPSSLFPSHLSYVALGHLHRQQKMPHSSAVWYSGSPLQLDFGEVADQKGALLIDAQPGLPSTVTAAPLSGGRKLATIRGTLEEVIAIADQYLGVYTKVELTEKARVGLADEVRAVLPDAVEVVLESEEPEKRAADRRRGLDPNEAFSQYLAERGSHDERVASLFSDLMSEVTT